MGLQINTNVAAMNAYRNLSSTQNAMSTSLERLSSGLRINRAADDAAGLAISEKLRAQSNGLNQATANAQDGISLIQTAEGALNETHSILQRMRQLAVQSANDTNTDQDRTAIQSEVTQLSNELDRISGTTQFNGTKLLNGDAASGLKLQVGANSGDSMSVSIGKMDSATLGIKATKPSASSANGAAVADASGSLMGSFTIKNNDVLDTAGNKVGAYAAGKVTWTDTTKTAITFDKAVTDTSNNGAFTVSGAINVGTQANASAALDTIDNALNQVSSQRADLGAVQNRLQHTINSLSVAAENASAAESRIRDTDMAKEMTSFTRSQILQQAGVSMLAQANSAPQSVLKLLG
ncbi:flagellin [Pedococcus sp. KACC 23699]|uniref:Flagellin n=1 Tax=Pedococcus sp. KACC 23699 TaxID=3149228 RepID=A0AAU7JZG6_9MICO